jgi:amidase
MLKDAMEIHAAPGCEEPEMTAQNGLVMSWEEWGKQDAIALADLVKAKQVTAKELVAQAAAAIERLNPKVEAVLSVYDDVMANADADGPNKDGRLYGVPMLLKDLGSGLKGRKQESGSKLFKDNTIKATDPVVENYLRAGLIPIGRSTSPEFGMTFDTVTDYLGVLKVTRNPWNLERTPGGSSGGSAAAVAGGVMPISRSSDGGGSTRIPASFSALVGLKASRGRVPKPLLQSEYTTRISIDGVLTRSVRDTAAAYDYITRIPDGGAFIHMGSPSTFYSAAITRDPGKLKVGLSVGRWGRESATDPEVAARVCVVAKVLEDLGHHIEEFDDAAACDWESLWRAYITNWISCRAQFRTTAEDRGIEPRKLNAYLGPMVYRHYLAAERYDKFDIWKMMDSNNKVTRAFGRFMSRFDVLLVPTLAIRVPKANGPYSLLLDEELDQWVARLCDACRYTMPGNETGMPGISVPAGLDRDGLPIGIQLYGKWAREDLLLQLAAQIERAKPEWFRSVPPVHVASRS